MDANWYFGYRVNHLDCNRGVYHPDVLSSLTVTFFRAWFDNHTFGFDAKSQGIPRKIDEKVFDRI